MPTAKSDAPQAIVLIGHGSLRGASGAAMIRVAARLRERGVAPIAEASFLNFSRPTLAEAVERCVAQGAAAITIQPYFLVAGKYVQHDLPRQLAEQRARHPQAAFRSAGVFGDHPALAELALARARGAMPLRAGEPCGLLLLAHGSPLAGANAPLERLAERIAASGEYARVALGYLECNAPSVPEAIDALVGELGQLVALPYFLQLGRHVADDLPRLVAQARARHPRLALALAPHLGYDPVFADVIAARVAQAS